MSEASDPVRTFRLRMRSLPVLKSALLVMADQPPEAQSLAGTDLTAMAADLLGLLTEAEHETYEKHAEAPMSPSGDAPRIEADLDRAEAVALAHSVMAVRYAETDGPMDRLLLKAMVDFYPQMPTEWTEDAGAPLTEAIETVRTHVGGER